METPQEPQQPDNTLEARRSDATLAQGDLLYFKHASKRPGGGKKKMFEFQRSHGYGMFLGLVPEGMPPPPIEVVSAAIATLGYIRLDDIEQFLGIDTARDLAGKVGAKYTALMQEIAAKAVRDGAIKKLVGPDGKPLIDLSKAPPTL